jgi:hypothetical protein
MGWPDWKTWIPTSSLVVHLHRCQLFLSPVATIGSPVLPVAQTPAVEPPAAEPPAAEPPVVEPPVVEPPTVEPPAVGLPNQMVESAPVAQLKEDIYSRVECATERLPCLSGRRKPKTEPQSPRQLEVSEQQVISQKQQRTLPRDTPTSPSTSETFEEAPSLKSDTSLSERNEREKRQSESAPEAPSKIRRIEVPQTTGVVMSPRTVQRLFGREISSRDRAPAAKRRLSFSEDEH